MRRFAIAPWVLLAACRGNFDAPPDAAVDAVVEEPLPEFSCARATLDIEGVGPETDLAVARDGDAGYVVAWGEAARRLVHLARFDRSFVLQARGSFATDSAVMLPGLEVRPERIWLVTTAGANQTLWSVSRDLATTTKVAAEDTVAGNDPIGVADSGQQALWVRGARNSAGLLLTVLKEDGTLGAAVTTVPPAPIAGLSAGDYANHVHVAWRDPSGRCYGGDVFATPPSGAPNASITNDCSEIRVVADAPPFDPLISTWTSAAGVHASYIDYDLPSGKAFDVMLGPGRSSRIAYDNELFWVTWLDDTGLRVARIDATGQVSRYPALTTGAASDAAFELVRRGNSVSLALISGGKLTLHRLCVK